MRFLPTSLSDARRRVLVGSAAVIVLCSVGGAPADAAKKTTKPKVPVAGGTCAPLGAHAAGTSLDCVKNGSKLQWQPKGSKLNPFKIGETFEWTQSSNMNNPDALISTRRISVVEYLPDASAWVSSHTDQRQEDIFAAAKGVAVRGVKVNYTMVSATDASSRNLGSLTTFWLGDDRDAGCCSSGVINWAGTPDDAVDDYLRLEDGMSRTGIMVFAQTIEKLGPKPLMRLGWMDVRTGNQSYVYFAMTA